MSGIVRLDAAKLLSKVPEEYVFCCRDGQVFRDMSELGEDLLVMSDETFVSHSNTEKNDFANWVRDIIKDEKLARDLMNSSDREQAVKRVAGRATPSPTSKREEIMGAKGRKSIKKPKQNKVKKGKKK